MDPFTKDLDEKDIKTAVSDSPSPNGPLSLKRRGLSQQLHKLLAITARILSPALVRDLNRCFQSSIPFVGRIAQDHAEFSDGCRESEIVRCFAEVVVTVDDWDFHQLAHVTVGCFVPDLQVQQFTGGRWSYRCRGLILQWIHTGNGKVDTCGNNFEQRGYRMTRSHITGVLRIVVEVLVPQDPILISC